MRTQTKNLSFQEYIDIDAINHSGLKAFSKCPAKYKAYRDGLESESSQALGFGRAYHTLILEPDLFDKQYYICPHGATRATIENKEIATTGKELLAFSEGITLFSMQHAIKSHKGAMDLLDNMIATEVTETWVDKETGLQCKARVDGILSDGRKVDLKTTIDASPRAFANACARYNYYSQSAWYSEDMRSIVFIAQEKSAPYLVALYELDFVAMTEGKAFCANTLEGMRSCLNTGVFPGYIESVQTLSLPEWAVSVDDDLFGQEL